MLSLFEQQHIIWISVAFGALEKDVACGLRDMQGIVRGVELTSANTSDLLCAICVQHKDTAHRHLMRREGGGSSAGGPYVEGLPALNDQLFAFYRGIAVMSNALTSRHASREIVIALRRSNRHLLR